MMCDVLMPVAKGPLPPRGVVFLPAPPKRCMSNSAIKLIPISAAKRQRKHRRFKRTTCGMCQGSANIEDGYAYPQLTDSRSVSNASADQSELFNIEAPNVTNSLSENIVSNTAEAPAYTCPSDCNITIPHKHVSLSLNNLNSFLQEEEMIELDLSSVSPGSRPLSPIILNSISPIGNSQTQFDERTSCYFRLSEQEENDGNMDTSKPEFLTPNLKDLRSPSPEQTLDEIQNGILEFRSGHEKGALQHLQKSPRQKVLTRNTEPKPSALVSSNCYALFEEPSCPEKQAELDQNKCQSSELEDQNHRQDVGGLIDQDRPRCQIVPNQSGLFSRFFPPNLLNEFAEKKQGRTHPKIIKWKDLKTKQAVEGPTVVKPEDFSDKKDKTVGISTDCKIFITGQPNIYARRTVPAAISLSRQPNNDGKPPSQAPGNKNILMPQRKGPESLEMYKRAASVPMPRGSCSPVYALQPGYHFDKDNIEVRRSSRSSRRTSLRPFRVSFHETSRQQKVSPSTRTPCSASPEDLDQKMRTPPSTQRDHVPRDSEETQLKRYVAVRPTGIIDFGIKDVPVQIDSNPPDLHDNESTENIENEADFDALIMDAIEKRLKNHNIGTNEEWPPKESRLEEIIMARQATEEIPMFLNNPFRWDVEKEFPSGPILEL